MHSKDPLIILSSAASYSNKESTRGQLTRRYRIHMLDRISVIHN